MKRAQIIPTDNISKGACLAFANLVYRRPEGGWRIDAGKRDGFHVTPQGKCDCLEYAKSRDCMHVWASYAANAAFAITHIRSAYTIEELREVGLDIAGNSEAWKRACPAEHLEIARDAYRKRRAELAGQQVQVAA